MMSDEKEGVTPDPSRKGPGTYDILADKVGFVPNVRKKDNIYQALGVLACALVGVAVGFFAMGGLQGLLVGLLVGLVGGLLVSGFVLMIVGLARK